MLPVLKTNIKIILISAVLLFFGYAGQPWAAEQQVRYQGTISAAKLNVRAKPSRLSDVVIVLKKNDVVEVLEKSNTGGWLKVTYKNRTGYIRNRTKYVRLKEVKDQSVARKKASVKEARKAQKKEIEKKITAQEKLVDTFSEKEVEIIEGLNEIDYALNRARIKVTALSTEMEQLEAKINTLSRDSEKLAAEIRVNNVYTGKRLKALYKMNMIGRLDAAGLPSSVFDFILKQNSMKRIIASDFKVLEKQNADLEQFAKLQTALKHEVKSKTQLEVELQDQIRINKKESLKRELILQDIRKKKKLSLAAVEALKNAAAELDNQINNLDTGNTNSLNHASFSSRKGRLIFPVKGRIISEFGPSQIDNGGYKAFTYQKGIDIKVERGEPVKSVFKGVVMFSEWLKGYGNLMIINHGDNYYTLYAHLEELFKQQGEHVDTGEVIATAGDTGSIKGMRLHFEVRHHGKPVNPMKWLRKGA